MAELSFTTLFLKGFLVTLDFNNTGACNIGICTIICLKSIANYSKVYSFHCISFLH